MRLGMLPKRMGLVAWSVHNRTLTTSARSNDILQLAVAFQFFEKVQNVDELDMKDINPEDYQYFQGALYRRKEDNSVESEF